MEVDAQRNEEPDAARMDGPARLCTTTGEEAATDDDDDAATSCPSAMTGRENTSVRACWPWSSCGDDEEDPEDVDAGMIC